jgi:hypothetical protein
MKSVQDVDSWFEFRVLTVKMVNPNAAKPPKMAVAAAAKTRTRNAITTLAVPTIFDQYGIGTTWALVSAISVDLRRENSLDILFGR